MPNTKNKNIVENLSAKVAKAKSIIFADYANVKSNDLNDLRNKIKEAGGEVSVSKNTLLRIALKENGIDAQEASKDLTGQTTAVFSYADPISPIKILVEFAKRLEVLTLRSAFVDGKYTDANQIETLSTLPSREVLLSRVFSGMKSPITGFVNVMSGTKRQFVTVLSEIAKKK